MSEAEKLGAGRPGATDAEHVDLFIASSGLQNGAVSFELARDILVFFYTELYSELCASPGGPKVIGLQLLAANQKLDQLLTVTSPAGQPVGESYSVRPELDTVKRASTAEDREAEIQLDLIRQLVDRRQGRAALQLLADLQPKVDRGALSTLVRARFFINKGVCHLVCDEQELAVREFERARVLDPMNPKALINLAQVALLRRDYDQALELVNRVIEVSPKDVNAFSVRLACLHQLGRKDELENLIASNSWLLNEQSCLYTVGYIAFDEQRFEEAEHYLQLHNEKDAKYAEAWNLLGSAILVPAQHQIQERAAAPNLIPAELRSRLVEAEQCFNMAEQLLASCDSRRELAHTYANRGVSRMFLSEFDDGRRDFERSLDIDPSSDEVRRNLGVLFLHTGKAEEAIKVFEQISNPQVRESLTLQLAAAYLDAGKPAEARRTVETALQSAPLHDAILLIDLFLIACHRLREIEPTEAKIAQLELAAIDEPEANRALGQHWLRLGETPKAVAAMRRAIEIAPETRKPRYRLILAEIHYRLMQYAEAADEYERVPVVVDRSDDTRRYVAALYAAGRLAKALQWTRAVRGQLDAVPDFSEIEALVLERSGDLQSANVLRQALLANEVAPNRQLLKIGANLVRLGQGSTATALIEKVTLEAVKDDPELLFEAARLRTILEMPDALKFAYRLLRIEFSNPETHLFYTGTFFRREKVDEQLFHPTVVELDCTVLIRHGNETQRYTIVESEGDTATNHISSSHPLAVMLLGRTTGEKFCYPANSPAAAEYEIQQVQSKYVFAFQECLSHFNERFPAHKGLSRMEVDPADPTQIVGMLEAQRARSEKIFEMYRSGSLPACVIARLTGRSDVELFRGLLSESSVRVLSSSASRDELMEELKRLRAVNTVLVESSALVTLETLGLLPALKERFTSVRVTQQTLDSVVETALNITPEKQTGHISSDAPGHIQLIEHTATEMNAEKEFFQRIENFLRSSAQITAPDEGPALVEYERMDVRTTLGAAAASTVAAARGEDIMIYSDDLALRVVARNDQKIHSFWTQTLLQDLRERALISLDAYHRAVAQLIELGFHFVSVNSADLVWAIRETSWAPSQRVSKIVATLAGPDCLLNDAVNVALEVLHEIWADPIPRATKLAFLDMIIQVLVSGRDGAAVLAALSVRNATRSLIWTRATNEIQQSIKIWFYARSKGLVRDGLQRFIVSNQN